MSRPPRSLLSNTVASGIAIGWTAIVTVALTPFLIRELGAAAYGAWVLLTVFLIQGRGLASLLDLGLQQSLIQRIAAAPDLDEASRRLGAALRALVCLGVLSALVAIAAAPVVMGLFKVPASVEGDTVTALRILGLQLALDIPAVAFASALEGLRRYEVRRVIDVGRITLFGALAAVAAVRGWGVVGLAAASFASTAAFAVASAVATVRCGLRPSRGATVRVELRHGRPLIALRATGVVYRQLDKLVLGAIVGTVAAAGFDVAEKVNLAAVTVIGIATSALIPAAAEGLRTDPERIRRLVLTATKWSALAAMPLAGLAIGVATPLARLIAGQHIDGTDAAIRWLSVATALSIVAAAAVEMGIGAGVARRIAPISVGGLAVNVIATIVLAQQFGLPGSAAASAVAFAIEIPLLVHVLAGAFDHQRSHLVGAAAPGWAVGGAVAVASFAFAGGDPSTGALVRGCIAGGLVTLVAAAIVLRRGGLPRRTSTDAAPT